MENKKLEGIKGWLLIYIILIALYGVGFLVIGVTEIPGALADVASERLSYSPNLDYNHTYLSELENSLLGYLDSKDEYLLFKEVLIDEYMISFYILLGLNFLFGAFLIIKRRKSAIDYNIFLLCASSVIFVMQMFVWDGYDSGDLSLVIVFVAYAFYFRRSLRVKNTLTK